MLVLHIKKKYNSFSRTKKYVLLVVSKFNSMNICCGSMLIKDWNYIFSKGNNNFVKFLHFAKYDVNLISIIQWLVGFGCKCNCYEL
jgi:hypothetical protein